VTAVETRSDHDTGNGAGNGTAQRNSELAPFPVPARNGHAPDPALEGAEEVELLAVRLWPVVKVTAFFATATAAVWLAALGVAWVAATSLGLTHSFESFVREIGFEGFQLDARPVFLAVGLLGLAWIVSIVVLALLAAACYNAFASLCGGFRYLVRPRDTTHAPTPNGAAARDGEAAAAKTAS
jgi:Transmembrane domain of unknown function (DUF3566)